jgi:hypothetical protein
LVLSGRYRLQFALQITALFVERVELITLREQRFGWRNRVTLAGFGLAYLGFQGADLCVQLIELVSLRRVLGGRTFSLGALLVKILQLLGLFWSTGGTKLFQLVNLSTDRLRMRVAGVVLSYVGGGRGCCRRGGWDCLITSRARDLISFAPNASCISGRLNDRSTRFAHWSLCSGSSGADDISVTGRA